MNQVPTATAPTVQLLLWIAEQPRTYAETIEVWKTSCPRLAVWEDALAADLVRLDRRCVLLTAAGIARVARSTRIRQLTVGCASGASRDLSGRETA